MSTALKLRARGESTPTSPERAIQDMRTALAQAPRDPEIMTIMALAHERAAAAASSPASGCRCAVEASDQAPAESLRYARFLMQDDRIGPAEGVIVDALRRAPDEPATCWTCSAEIHLAAPRLAAGRPGGGPAAQTRTTRRPARDGGPRSRRRACGPGPHRRHPRAARGPRRRPATATPRRWPELMQRLRRGGRPRGGRSAYLDGVLASGSRPACRGRLMQAGLAGAARRARRPPRPATAR